MDLKRIDFEEATRIYEALFIGKGVSFYGEEEPGIHLIGDMLWDELAEAEFLLGYEGDEPLGMAIYSDDVSDYDGSRIAAVKLYGILTYPDEEQRASNFVDLLFQLRARFQQAKGEYFTAEAAPYDDFTVQMLEATEFKLVAPFALMYVPGGEAMPDYEVKKADSFDMTIDTSKVLPGADPFLGEMPTVTAATAFEMGIGSGITYEVNRSGGLSGYLCVVPDPGATMLFGESYGKLLYAHPWDTFALYDAAAQIEEYAGITVYAPLTVPRLVQSLEDAGYRTVGGKLSFRLNLL